MKDKYCNKLYSSVLWGFDKERTAYIRTVDYIKAHSESHSIEQFEKLREELLSKAMQIIEDWFEKIYERAEDKNNVFDLSMTEEEIWRHITCINHGIFDKEYGGDPWVAFCRTLTSMGEKDKPLMVCINIDGWGIEESVEKKILEINADCFCADYTDSVFLELLIEDFQGWSIEAIDKLILILKTNLNKDERLDLNLLNIMIPLFRVHYQLSASIQEEITRAFEEYKDEEIYIKKCQVIPDLRNALVFWERDTLGNLELNILGNSTKRPEALKAMNVIHDAMRLEESKKADDQKIIVE